ncbi:MAG: type II toxin-antitoxin system HicB family antitoxin [Thermoleophilia bacterium]|nr:type II toxin-antitoxin system HicB family antitoxin [Thermoleophilia bacterium]
MAKVMISIPDALLERVDSHVSASGETRSGFLQRLAEHELNADRERRRKEFEEILGAPLELELDAAQLVREDRDSH